MEGDPRKVSEPRLLNPFSSRASRNPASLFSLRRRMGRLRLNCDGMLAAMRQLRCIGRKCIRWGMEFRGWKEMILQCRGGPHSPFAVRTVPLILVGKGKLAAAFGRRCFWVAARQPDLGARINRYRCCLPALAGFSIYRREGADGPPYGSARCREREPDACSRSLNQKPISSAVFQPCSHSCSLSTKNSVFPRSQAAQHSSLDRWLEGRQRAALWRASQFVAADQRYFAKARDEGRIAMPGSPSAA